jgi:hypothetical protein
MQYEVFRALDRPSAFFGIKGTYISWVGAGLVVDLFFSLIVGVLTAGFIGFVVFLLGAVCVYGYVMMKQGRMSDRRLARKMAARQLPYSVRVRGKGVQGLLRKEMDEHFTK